MNLPLKHEIMEVIGALHLRPAVSIIMPFEPKIALKTELAYSLKIAADKVEKELLKQYPQEISMMVTGKLRTIIKNISVDLHKKSIAIYVSPSFEKVLFLDIAVEEKIIIDESFEIRDLVYSKKELNKYLILIISEKKFNIYIGDTASLVKIAIDSSESVYSYINEVPERVSNFSDPSERKEIIMNKFLKHIDNTLDNLLNVYYIPLFVMGTDRIIGHFKKYTRHTKAVNRYIKGNYAKSTVSELKDILKPHINDWKKIRQTGLLEQLNAAAGGKKLISGIKNVWREVKNQKGRLLVVEKNYMYAALHEQNEQVIYKAEEASNKLTFISDAVDDIIEEVLKNGGEVEFVDTGMLKEYEHIALIQYF